jgi:GST-like protein
MDNEHILYGYKGSGSAAIEVALALAGVPHRIVDAASWDDNSALEELKRVNPLAQIPTLVLPDGSVMTESAAILVELGLRHPTSGLLPAEPRSRAQAIRGLVYIAANCYAAIGVIDYPERWCMQCDDATHDRIRAGTRSRLHALWDRFADQFDAAPWLGGTQLGALDLLAAVVSKWSGSRPHLEKSRPQFHALLQRIEAHPQVTPVFARHWS